MSFKNSLPVKWVWYLSTILIIPIGTEKKKGGGSGLMGIFYME